MPPGVHSAGSESSSAASRTMPGVDFAGMAVTSVVDRARRVLCCTTDW